MKKYLLSLFVGFVGIISFCSAEEYIFNANNLPSSITFENPINDYEFEFSGLGYIYGGQCRVNIQTVDGGSLCYYQVDSSNVPSTTCDVYTPLNSNYPSVNGPFKIRGLQGGCLSYNPDWSLRLYISEENTCDYSDYVPLSDYNNLLNNYNILSGELINLQNNYNTCQSDLNSCQSFTSGFNEQLNNCNSELVSCNSSLSNCLQYNCPETELSYSKFYVRHGESTWFQLTGMENYYVYLPDYLSYNYDYSNGTDLDFTVGVATDTGYINNISAIQNSKPSQEDLNKLVSEVLPLFVPGLAVILLLYFIFRFIKKVF